MPVLSKEAFRDALPIIGNGAYLVRAIVAVGTNRAKRQNHTRFVTKRLCRNFFRFSIVLTFFAFLDVIVMDLYFDRRWLRAFS